MPAIAEHVTASFWGNEQFARVLALLDALIQLGAPLDEATLKRISQDHPYESTILMLQHPFANQTLLESMRKDRPGSSTAIAAANALVSMRNPGLAAALLREMNPTHWIQVTDEGEFPPIETGGISSLPPAMRIPLEFPPTYLYRLSTRGAPSEAFVNDGSTPVYLQRFLLEPGVEQKVRWQEFGKCLQCLRIGHLADLAYLKRAEVESSIQPFTVLRPSDPLDAEISRALAKQINALNHVKESLLRYGALQTTELPITLRITVKINDRREDKSQPLGPIPPLEVVLH